MRRALVATWATTCALALSCGVVHHDYDVSQPFSAGGGAPSGDFSINLAEPLAASAGDLSKLSSITLQDAKLLSTDGGDLAFISSLTLTIAGSGLPTVTLASLTSPPAASVQTVDLGGNGTDLKPYLAVGSILTAHATYVARPVDARALLLTLTIRGTL